MPKDILCDGIDDIRCHHDIISEPKVRTEKCCDDLHKERKELTQGKFSSLPKDSEPPEDKITAIAAVMCCKQALKGGQYDSSNRHMTKNVVQVLLVSGLDGDQLFHKKGKAMLFHSSKRLVPLS